MGLSILQVVRPRCFGKTYDPKTYVDYYSNKSAWMVAAIFEDWLCAFDRKMRRQKRKVILLMDNASSHKISRQLQNVRVHFLPPNTTAHIQPLDAGIISAVKRHYKRDLSLTYMRKAEEDQPQTITIREAIKKIATAWDRVAPQTITNCFRHTGIMPPTPAACDDPAQSDDPEDDMSLADLQAIIRKLTPDGEAPVSAEDFLTCDDEEPTGEVLSMEDILALTSAPVAEEEEEEEDVQQPPTDITLKEGHDMLLRLPALFEQTTEGREEELEQNRAFLKQLDSMLSIVKKRMHASAKQTEITAFFVKNNKL